MTLHTVFTDAAVANPHSSVVGRTGHVLALQHLHDVELVMIPLQVAPVQSRTQGDSRVCWALAYSNFVAVGTGHKSVNFCDSGRRLLRARDA